MVLQPQAAEGTADTFSGAAGEIGLLVTDEPDIKPTIEKDFKKFYMKSPAETQDFLVKRLGAGGDFTCPAYTAGPLEAFLYGVFGAVDSTVITDTTTAYANVFSMDNDTLPIWTMAVGRDDLNYQEFYDMRFGSVEFTMKPGSEISAKVTTQGKGGAIDNAAIADDDLNFPATRSFVFDDVGVSIGGSPNCDVTSVDLKIDRGMKALRTACAASPKGDNVFYPTTIDVNGTIEMFFQDYTEYKYWLGSSSATEPTYDQDASTTKRALVIQATGEAIGDGNPADTAQLTFTIPAVVYDTAEIDMPFDDRMKLVLKFKALYDATTEASVAGTGVICAQLDSDFNAETAF